MLCVLALLGGVSGELCSEVTSVAVCAGGTCYRQVYFIAVPFSSLYYRVTERSQYVDRAGHVIIDIGRERQHGDMLRRFLDVQVGSGSFSMPLAPVAR